MKPFSTDIRDKKISEIFSMTNGDVSKESQFLDDYLNINSINLDLSENLYRIFDWKYFIKDLRDKRLTLVRTHKWEDPFENFLLKAKGHYNGRDVDLANIRNSFYISCWSLNSECDGIWRNYKPNKKSCVVKVRTNAKNLFESIYDINNNSNDSNYFIGKVEYVNDNAIVKKFRRKYDIRNLDDGLIFAQQLFIKRKPFKYEQEVRIVMRDDNNSADIIQVSIDPNLIFEEIVLDPWIKLSTYIRKKKEIENAGFTGKITRSSLYDQPFFIFKIK